MGVIIYELINLKKPFTGKNFQEVVHNIKNTNYAPLPESTSAQLKILINNLLNKNQEKRSSIFEIAKLPFIMEKIEHFIQEHDCSAAVMPFFDPDCIEQRKRMAFEKNSKIQT